MRGDAQQLDNRTVNRCFVGRAWGGSSNAGKNATLIRFAAVLAMELPN